MINAPPILSPVLNAGTLTWIAMPNMPSYIDSTFPFETFRCHAGSKKICCSPTQAIYDWHGYNVAKYAFNSKGIVSFPLFDQIYWEGMKKAVSKFPPTFNSWIAKHVSHFCGTNRQLSRMDKSDNHSMTRVPPILLAAQTLEELRASKQPRMISLTGWTKMRRIRTSNTSLNNTFWVEESYLWPIL